MHLRNKTATGFLFILLLGLSSILWAQGQPPAQPSQPQSGQQKPRPTTLPADVDPADPALPVWAKPAPPAQPPQPGGETRTGGDVPSKTTTPSGQPPPAQTTGEVTTDPSGGFRLTIGVDEVRLQATVLDQKKHLVTDLAPRNFTVYEDGQPQKIISFKREDVPVSIGIVVDNSGSMRTKRNAVIKAVVNLVQASNPSDEVFIVNFNDDPYLDQDFTNQLSAMREALEHVDTRGGTALYDAVYAASEHLAKGAKREKKVLLVVTDGEDNESRLSLEQAIRAVQDENGPIIYTIGILGEEGKQRRAKRALEALSLQTGGLAFFPKNLAEVDEISREVARDIRNQYTITYKPTNPRSAGGYRAVKVVAKAPGYGNLQVRTRSGYFANDKAKTASNKPGGQ